MQLIIDLDGTICTEERQFSHALAKPLPGALEAVRKLRADGHTVIIYSARPWVEYELTVHWLSQNQFEYDQLVLGKPQGDYWIDDRAVRHTDWTTTLGVVLRAK